MSCFQATGSPAAAAATSDSVSRSPRRAACRSVRDVRFVMAGTLHGGLWVRLGFALGHVSRERAHALWGMFISFTINPALLPYESRRRAWIHAREEARAAYRDWVEADKPDRDIAF